MHRLDGVDVPRRDEDEVGGDGLRLDHRAGRAFRLADDRELPLLEGGQERVLALDLEEVDLVDEQDAAVRLVDRPDLDPLVRRRLEPARLERVVLDVPEQGAGVGAGGVDERRRSSGVWVTSSFATTLPGSFRLPGEPGEDDEDQDDEQPHEDRGRVVVGARRGPPRRRWR